LGIETLGAVTTKLIERNTTIPTRKSQIFTTAADNQTSVEVNVLQGERPLAKDNVSLGRFTLVGIPPAPRGIPQVEVTFDIDANGIIHVSAKDLATKKEQRITITAPHKLSREDIDAKIKDAERFAADDLKRKEEIEVTNAADSLVYASEKMLKEAGDVATAEQKEKIEKAIGDLKNAQTGGDISEIKSKTESLQTSIYELSAAMYQKAASEQQAQQGQSSQSAEPEQNPSQGQSDQTVDADYEVVNDKK
jgi:molecular chaperone DnaK